jgi:hypothetical protein
MFFAEKMVNLPQGVAAVIKGNEKVRPCESGGCAELRPSIITPL